MRSAKDKQGYWILAGAAIFIAGIFVARFVVGDKPKPGEDGCLGEGTESTVIVIDHSDEVSVQTLAEVSARAKKFVGEHVGVNGRVSVFTISKDSKMSLHPIFSRCRPQFSGNPLTENVPVLKKKFLESFQEPLFRAINQSPGVSQESPIAQTLTDLALSEYLRAKSNRLLVFSDLLENTANFSLYHCVSGPAAVSSFRTSRKGAMERPTFRNTTISLNIIPRLQLSTETIECRTYFWNWFLGDSEGETASVTIDYLPGGPTK